MSEFIKNCDMCREDLIVTNNAFNECNMAQGESTAGKIQVGVLAVLLGFFIGRGVK